MGSPVPLRDDFNAALLRLLARRTQDAGQGRRLLALAAIYDGGLRGDAARIGSVGLQTVRDWVLRFGVFDRAMPCLGRQNIINALAVANARNRHPRRQL